MAERRMFAKTIIDSDAFLEMPSSTQALYFHLGMRGDDEGFVNNPRKIQRTVGCSDDDLKLLIAKRFIIPFESGIVVIKHWKLHNYIRKDRLKETVYQNERELLAEKDNGAYTLKDLKECLTIDGQMSDECQHRLGKVRLGKDSISVCGINPPNQPETKFIPPTLEEIQAYCKERGNNVNPERWINHYTANGWKVGKNKMKDWKAAVRTWENPIDNKGVSNNGKLTGDMGKNAIDKSKFLYKPTGEPTDGTDLI